MSRPRSIALAMKERLEEIPELQGKVIFYRRCDIESEFDRRMEKTRGIAVIIRLISSKNQTEKKIVPRFDGTFTVSLFTVPTLTQKDAKAADDLMQEIAEKIHGWWPEPIAPSNGLKWFQAGAITYPEDALFDVSVLSILAP